MRNIFEIKDCFKINANVKSVLQYGNLQLVPHPTVTIIIPCYNHPKYLRKALLSAINQDYKEPYEIIVVDNDDSSDYTENRKITESLDNPKVLYYHNEKNIGGLGNWNRGVELARAPYITYCHDDDMLLPNCLSILTECQKRHGTKAVFGIRNHIDSNDMVTFETQLKPKLLSLIRPKKERRYTLTNYFLLPMGFCVGSLYNRENFIALGGFSEDFSPLSDAAFAGLYTKSYGAVQPLMPTHNYRFAENDTFNVYMDLAPMARYFRACTKTFIPCPGLILDRIIKACYEVGNYGLMMSMAPDKSKLHRPKWSDRMISRLSSMIDRTTMYRLL